MTQALYAHMNINNNKKEYMAHIYNGVFFIHKE
jgi:hypothetical protein